MRWSTLLSALLALPVAMAACGKKGPPLPPLVRLPAAPADVKASLKGNPYAADRRIREARGADLWTLRGALEAIAELRHEIARSSPPRMPSASSTFSSTSGTVRRVASSAPQWSGGRGRSAS